MQNKANEKILRLTDVKEITGLSRSTIYNKISKNTFPKPVSLGVRATGWVQREINDWIAQRIDERNSSHS